MVLSCGGRKRPSRADVDEVEFSYRGREDLGLVVRHSFTGGWSVRVAFLNHTLQPLRLAAELAWIPAATSPARALGAGATGAYAVPGPDGTGPLLGGELVLGTCDAVSADSIGLGWFTLGPLERQVVQWRWSWFDDPVTFRDRFAAVPRDLVLPDGETALIAADDDEAVVAPGIEVTRRGAHLELSSPGPAVGDGSAQLAPRGDQLRHGVGRSAGRGAGRDRRTAAGGAAQPRPGWSGWPIWTPPWWRSAC